MKNLLCRGCGAVVTTTMVDLGVQPLSNAYVSRDRFFVHLGVFDDARLPALAEAPDSAP